MFDRINQSFEVPLYPTKRPRHLLPQPTPCSLRRLPDAWPIHTSPHGLQPLPQLPPPHIFNAQGRRPYSPRPVTDSGETDVPKTAPSKPCPRLTVPANGSLEFRRTIRRSDYDDVDGWRASGIGNGGSSDAVGIRPEPSHHRFSRGMHLTNVSVHFRRGI